MVADMATSGRGRDDQTWCGADAPALTPAPAPTPAPTPAAEAKSDAADVVWEEGELTEALEVAEGEAGGDLGSLRPLTSCLSLACRVERWGGGVWGGSVDACVGDWIYRCEQEEEGGDKGGSRGGGSWRVSNTLTLWIILVWIHVGELVWGE